MWDRIREYLTFTRKERLGALGMVIGIVVLLIVPNFFRRKPGSPDPDAFKKYQPAAKAFADGRNASADSAKTFTSEKSAPEAFPFDPNQLSAEGWAKLGVREKTIHTIQHFLASGGLFRQAEDLQKIYGLSMPDYHRLLPLVRMKKTEPVAASATWANRKYYVNRQSGAEQRGYKRGLSFGDYRTSAADKDYKPVYHRKTASDININAADSVQLTAFPGIGPALASRILRFRDKLGGFVAVNQVGETFGLPDTVFQALRPFLHVSADSIRRIDLNEAAESQLQQHPYIRWALAKAILRYREQHGRFHSVEELQQLAQIDPQKFKQLAPYLEVRK